MAIKSIVKKEFCVICTAISITWITLLALYLAKAYNDALLIGILMGQSIVGVFYLLESKVREELKIFRLPFILTLTLIAYSLLSKTINMPNLMILLAITWAITFIIYIYRNSPKVNSVAKKMLECCKRW